MQSELIDLLIRARRTMTSKASHSYMISTGRILLFPNDLIRKFFSKRLNLFGLYYQSALQQPESFFLAKKQVFAIIDTINLLSAYNSIICRLTNMLNL